MKYLTIKPSGKLYAYIRCYWIYEDSVSGKGPFIHRTMASPAPELLFHYKGTFKEMTPYGTSGNYFLTGIHAQTDNIRRFGIHSDFGIFGISLQPYAIPVLFGVSSLEIKNQVPDLVTLLGQEGKVLEEKMMTAENNVRRLHIINRFFEQRLSEFERPEVVHAAQSIQHHRGAVHLKKLKGQYGLSERQLERKFKEHIGFSLKTFSRIVRFESLLNSYGMKNTTLTQMAHNFGYYDQAHFIHEFKQFSGYNPKTYFSGKANEAFYTP